MTAGLEWRQFRLLSHDAVRRLLNTALSARDIDPVQFALWMVALVSTAPTFYAFNQTLGYAALRRAPAAVIERAAMGDRLFFVIYAMLASALLAALTWEALFPDRADQEIVGVLPVRPRTVAAARFGALATMAIGYAAAINAPAAVIFSCISAIHPAVGTVPGVLAGHVLSTLLACVFVFFTLVAIRGLVALCAGPNAAAWLRTVLQIVTVVLLVQVLFFLPAVLASLVGPALDGAAHAMLAPIWFAALYTSIAGGTGATAFLSLGGFGVLAALSAASAATLVHLVSATRVGRRALETTSRVRASAVIALAGRIAAIALRRPAVRSIFMFAVESLARSPRHATVLATYFGLAVATGFISIVVGGYREPIPLAQPSSPLLAIPLVFAFFATFGLRAATSIPTDLDANWPFRLVQPPPAVAVRATEALLLIAGVVPVTIATLLAALALWSPATALAVASFVLVSGIALIESALWGWAHVPFACAHVPSSETMRWRWPLYIVALNLYAFRLADFQQIALQSAPGTAIYLVSAVVAALGLRIARQYRLRRQPLQFDVVSGERVEALNLSEAVN